MNRNLSWFRSASFCGASVLRAVAILVVCASAGQLTAQTLNWVGLGTEDDTNNLLTRGANWSTGQATTSSDTAAFNGISGNFVTTGANLNVSSMTFNNSVVRLGPTNSTSATTDAQFIFNRAAGANSTIISASNSTTINFAGTTASSSTTTGTNSPILRVVLPYTGFGRIDIDATSQVNLSSSTGNSVVIMQGSGGIIKSGSGTLRLSGTHTYAGGFLLEAGTVVLTGSGNSNTVTGPLSSAFGTGTLQVTGGSIMSNANGSNNRTISNNLTLNGTLTLGAASGAGSASFINISTSSGTGNFGGSTTLAGNSTINTAAAGVVHTISQNISGGSFSLTKEGPGTLVLTGSGNSWTGGVIIANGTLQFNTAGSLGSAAQRITNNGNLSYFGPNLTHTGIISGTGNLTKGNNTTSTLTLSGTNNYTGFTSVTTGGLLGNIGSGELMLSGTGNYNMGTTSRTISGLSGNGTLITGTSSLTLTLNGTQATLFNGTISGNAGIVYSGTGALGISGAAIGYTGGTTVNSGTVVLVTTTARPSGSFTVGANGSLGLGVGGASGFATTDVDNLFAGNMTGNLSGISFTSTSGVGIDTTAGNFTYSTTQNTSRGLVKTGANTLTLTGSQTYGSIRVQGGTLESDTSLLKGTIVNNAILSFNQTSNGTFAGSLSGNGNVVKTGAASLSFDGATNSSTGSLVISQGTLSVGTLADASPLPASFKSDSVVINGGVFDYTGSAATSTSNRGFQVGSSGGTIKVANSLTINGTISDYAGQAGTLVKTGPGTLYIEGTGNTATGGLVINEGTVSVSSIGAAIATPASAKADAIVLNGGILEYTGTSVNSSSLRGFQVGSSGGTIKVSNALTINAIVSDVTGQAGVLIKSGPGSLLLNPGTTGINTLSGGIVIEEGALRAAYSNATAMSVGSAPITLGKIGGGSASFNATLGGYSFSNPITVTNGALGTLMLAVESTFAGSTIFSGNIAVNGNLTVSHSIPTTHRMRFDGIVSGSADITKIGTGELRFNNEGNTWSGNLNINEGIVSGAIGSGNLTIASGASYDLLSVNRSIGALNGAGTVTLGGNSITTTSSANANFSGNIAGTGALIKGGSGVLTLSGTSAYSGGTNLNGGTIAVAGNGALGDAAGVVNFGGGTLQATANFTANRPTALNSGGGSFNVDTGVLVNWNGNITGGAGNNLTKVGAGTLVLGGNNTYSGDTNVNAGILRLAVAQALSPNTKLNVAQGASFDANGFTQTVTALTGNGNVDVGSAGLTVQPAANTTSTFNGTIAGSGNFTMSGSGTLVLGNTNNYSGNTTISSGTVKLGASGALPTNTPVSLSSGATLDLNGYAAQVGKLEGAGTVALTGNTLSLNQTANTTFAGALSGTGAFTKLGTGVLNLTGNSTIQGGTTVSEGGLKVNGALTSDVTVASSAVLSGTGTITGAVNISGVHSPGNSPGVQSVAGNLTYNSGSSVNWELAGNTATQGSPTAIFDQISVSGTLNFAGPTTLNLSFNGSGSAVDWTDPFWTVNQSWKIYDSAALSNPGNLSLASTNWQDSNGALFNTALSGASFALRNTVSNEIFLDFTAATAIPEPATTAALVGVMGLAWAAYRRRRNF